MNLKKSVMRFFAGTIFAVFFLLGDFSLAAEETCLIQRSQDILDCALRHHPDVVSAEHEKERDQRLVDVAKQRPNPELESRVLGGKSGGERSFNSETALLTTWELGGKRRSRVRQATALGQKAQINVQEHREAVALQTVTSLYRLRHLQAELERVDETIATFDKILKTFKARPKLAPEQEVSFASFELAREEYKLKRAELSQEQSNLSRFLELVTSVPFETFRKYLPPFKSSWPEVPSAAQSETLGNAVLAKAKLDQTLAEAEVALAKSKAWPDLKIGPTVDTESLPSSTKLVGGIGFSLPLPILSQNRGEKAYTYAEKLRANTAFELTTQKIAFERELQRERYTSATEALRQSHPAHRLSLQHEHIEAFFEKGLVPSTLVIETHRQLYEITKTRNEQELTAIDALWNLYILDGRLQEGKI